MEYVPFFADTFQFPGVGLSAVGKDRLIGDEMLYGVHQVLPGSLVPGGKNEDLRHYRYAVYLAALPLARDAGYFLLFISSFA